MDVKEQSEALAGGVSCFEMQVRWGDLDALHHVNNTLYLRYLEEARVNRLHAAGIVGEADNNRSIVVAHTSCDYLRPIGWPATVLVDMQLVRVGRSSLEYQAELRIKGDAGDPCARARVVIVATDPATERSSPWTVAELQGLARVFRAPEP